ncbi:MAG: response regulator transcription factor [Clostridiales bacterium]|nr:response regulator transcription factor [Clostridiales bacterium]
MRILVAEDETHLNQLIGGKLQAEHYSVDSCFNGQEALDYLAGAEYDAVILDLMMPVLDGLAALQQMRRAGNTTPVLLLTARSGVDDRVEGLDAGADDYLTKPFSFDELLARIRVLLRRNSNLASNQITVADLTMDCAARSVTRAGIPISLSSREFDILEYLMRNQGVVLSREKIEQHIWNYDYAGGSNIVDVYIRYLRKKVDAAHEPKLIHTIRGAGYVLRQTP